MRRPARLLGMVLALAMTAATAACGAVSASEQNATGVGRKTLTVGVQEPFSAYHIEVGVAQGFFKDVGIDKVETRVFTSVPAMLTAVAKGQLEAGIQGIPAVWNFDQTTSGDKLKIFANKGFNTTHWAVSKSFAGATTSGDYKAVVPSWKGKRIGVPVLSGLVYNEARTMLSDVGLNPDKDVKLVAVGSGQQSLAALKQGLVDVVGTSATGLALIKVDGVGIPVLEGEQTPSTGSITTAWFTSESQLEKNHAFFKGLVNALTRSKQFIEDPANKDAVVKVLVDKMGLSQQVAEVVYEIDRPGWDDPLNKETFDRSVAALTRTGSLTGTPPAYDQIIADIAQ